MKVECDDQIVEIAKYFTKNNSTVRQTAKFFGISKSTVHKYLSSSLMNVNASLFFEVQRLLNLNKEQRHIRGGEATRKKYAQMKK